MRQDKALNNTIFVEKNSRYVVTLSEKHDVTTITVIKMSWVSKFDTKKTFFVGKFLKAKR